MSDLPLWLGRELYEIELAGEIVEERTKVVASRGRLLRRIDAWDDAARAAYVARLRRARARATRPGMPDWDMAVEPARPAARPRSASSPPGSPRSATGSRPTSRARPPGRLAGRAARLVTARRPARLEGVEDLPCQELVELVTDYLEDALPPAERARFDAHLAECPGCGTYVEQMRTTIALRRRERRPRERPEVSGLLEAFRDWKRTGA